jgi:hypothetical protein
MCARLSDRVYINGNLQYNTSGSGYISLLSFKIGHITRQTYLQDIKIFTGYMAIYTQFLGI